MNDTDLSKDYETGLQHEEEREVLRDEYQAVGEACGWPGDGSGMDDLEDFNQAEADDYRNEGDE